MFSKLKTNSVISDPNMYFISAKTAILRLFGLRISLYP